jgi:class 3 adenylate cyclase
MVKARHDRLVKLEFISQDRLRNDMNTSKEKLVLLMPKFVLERINYLEMSKNFVADDAGHVTILFCDICDFDGVIKELQDNVIQLLDDVFRTFDSLCKELGIQKIETVGKTYMACGGLKFIEAGLEPALAKKSPAVRTVQLAKSMMKFIDDYTYKAGKRLEIKIGVHYGQCIFGVLGYHKPQFSLIGDTINTTSRHCTTGKNGNIVLSEACWNEVKTSKVVNVIPNKVFMKGKGESEITVYIVSKHQKSSKKKKDERLAILQNRRVSFNPSLHGSFLKGSGPFSRNSLSPQKNGTNHAQDEINRDNDSQMEEDSQADHNISIQQDELVENSLVSHGLGSQSVLPEAREDAIDEAIKALRSQTMVREESQAPAIIGNLTEGDKDDIYLDDTLDPQQEAEILHNEHKKSFFEKKIVAEYSKSINIALVLLIIDIYLRELFIWVDSKVTLKFQYFRFFNFMVAVFLLILVVLKQLRENIVSFKVMICIAVVLRTSLQIIEYFLDYYTNYLDIGTRQYRLPQLFTNVVFISTIDLTFLVSFGIFYFRDIVIVNCLLGLIVLFFYSYFNTGRSFLFLVRLLVTIAYNLIDTWRTNKRELMAMFKIIRTKKESTYLSKFVDRLLPKHVSIDHPDPRREPVREHDCRDLQERDDSVRRHCRFHEVLCGQRTQAGHRDALQAVHRLRQRMQPVESVQGLHHRRLLCGHGLH